MLYSAAQLIASGIEPLVQNKRHIIIAIDGRCCSGKTTLSAHLQALCGCNVIHMDHFFLRPQQRTPERINTAGGNVDHERFLQEVLLPLSRNESFSYRPYDCKAQALTEAIRIDPNPINLVEGSYACHPALFSHYDLTVFLTVDEAEQMRRIEARNGQQGAVVFRERWIPLEEFYFSSCSVEDCCDLRFFTRNSAQG